MLWSMKKLLQKAGCAKENQEILKKVRKKKLKIFRKKEITFAPKIVHYFQNYSLKLSNYLYFSSELTLPEKLYVYTILNVIQIVSGSKPDFMTLEQVKT